MPYDLYGNHYRSAREAENAELAQMAEIDARLTQQEVKKERSKRESDLQDVWQYIQMLESRIQELEKKSS